MMGHVESLVTVASPDEPVVDVVARMAAGTAKYFGISLIVDERQSLLGIFNNGDLLRLVADGGDLAVPISDVMVSDPVVVKEGMNDQQVIHHVRNTLMERTSGRRDMTQYIPVLDSEGVVLDVLDMHELLARSPRQGDRVEVYGLGFVGLTLAAVLAARGHKVSGIDTNPDILRQLRSGQPHVHEPRLQEMMRQGLSDNVLFFDADPPETHSRIVIIAVGTPVDNQGLASMDALEAVCQIIGPRLRRGDIVMLRSTVPVGTTRSLVIPVLERTSDLKAGKAFHVAFCPERTVEGNAIQELTSLPQVVGGLTEICTEKAVSFWSTITDTVVRVDTIEGAELVKLINNSYRDLTFAFANELVFLSDRYNIDASRLIAAANEGYPRDRIPRPSPGVGGYCLTKDPYLYASVEALAAHGELSRVGRKINGQAGLYPVQIIERFARRLRREVTSFRVLIVGMAFKGRPETNDLRGSVSIDVANALIALGCTVECFDAVVAAKDLQSRGLHAVELVPALRRADVVLIMNNHDDNVPDGFLHTMDNGRPVLVFDGWNMLDRHEVERYEGIVYSSLGYMTPPKGLNFEYEKDSNHSM